MKHVMILLLASFCLETKADEVGKIVDQAIATVGGREKLLSAFRMTEFFNSGEKIEPVGSKKITPRTSVIEMPLIWRVGGKERGAEPGKHVVRAWSLDLLVDTKSEIKTVDSLKDEGVECDGLQISGSVNPPMTLYFDRQTHLLKRVDWRNDFYRFSDWRQLDGLKYAAKTSIFKISTGKAWFHHEITSLERTDSNSTRKESDKPKSQK